MNLIEWNEGMVIGVEVIDSEHQTLVALINRLDAALQDRKASEILGELLDQVLAYTVYHFNHEESLFAATPYPEKAEHAAEHARMTQRLSEMRADYRFGPSDKLAEGLLSFLKEWLMNHIQVMDRGFITYLPDRS